MKKLKLDQLYTARARRENGTIDLIEFELKGTDTSAWIISDVTGAGLTHTPTWLSGVMSDGSIVTFVDSLVASERTTRVGRAIASHEVKILPQLVCTGPRSVQPADRFRRLAVQLSDMSDVFYDFDAFGHAFNAEELMPSIARDWEARVGRSLKLGDQPQVAFFSGRLELLKFGSDIGEVSVRRSLQTGSGGGSGVRLRSELYLVIDFSQHLTLLETSAPLTAVMRFQEIMAGRRQSIIDFKLFTSDMDDNSPESPLSVYWPNQPCSKSKVSDDRLSPADLPMNGGIEPQIFAAVMARWLDMDRSRLGARIRFSDGFAKGNLYDIDRLIGAANMFDILPNEALPERPTLEQDLLEAKSQARRLFRNLPASPERDGVLGALGRIGTLSLRRKICHRSSILKPGLGPAFPYIDDVIGEAINCRNHFVHGSPATLDYSIDEARHLIPFYVNVLEFVFATSDLIEAGWNPADWATRGTSMTHPFGQLLIDYREKILNFKALMSAAGTQLNS